MKDVAFGSILLVMFCSVFGLIAQVYKRGVSLMGDFSPPLSGSVLTGGNQEDKEDRLFGIQKKLLLVNSDFSSESSFSVNLFPKIRIHTMPKKLRLVANIDFTEQFQKYEYAKSDGYGFAIKFFLDSINNGGFYNVFRKTNGGVGNDISRGLTGWVVGKNINGGYTWTIPLDQSIPIAVNPEVVSLGNQFRYTNLSDYLMQNIGKEIIIGVYLSSVKEFPGRKLMFIKELSLEYEGYNDDIEVMQP